MNKCRCISVGSAAFKKNSIYFYKFNPYEENFGEACYYEIHSLDGKLIQNYTEKTFHEHFLDIQEDRDQKLDNILG